MATSSKKIDATNAITTSDNHENTDNNSKSPLIYDQQQQKAKNIFSIDVTFSASSTDIQPSFDLFDEGDEDDSSSSGDRFRQHHQQHSSDLNRISGVKHAGKKADKNSKSVGTSRSQNQTILPNSTRAEILRKEMIDMHRRRHPESDKNDSKVSYLEDGISTNQIASGVKETLAERRRRYFIEEDYSSIGVPSDVSGMLQDSGVMENEPELDNATKHTNSRENEISRELQKGGESYVNPNGDRSSIKSSNNNPKTSSYAISDGRFGSINSVSNSFNSAAEAAIGQDSYKPRIGAGVVGQNNNNDILNERLERFHRYTRGPYAPLDRCNSTSVSSAHSSTLCTHYYPDGGYGWVILATASIFHTLMCGLHLSGGIFILDITSRFGEDLAMNSVWLVSFSMGSSLFLSPLWVSICKRRSTRLTALLGGLVTSLACLFTSFATQFHQTFISFGIILSCGIGLSREASSLMVTNYFKRRKHLVETFLVASSGSGILVMTLALSTALSSLGWRFGLQAITGGMFSTFILSSLYKSVSLFHPQRRAILHLKNQKRKIKEKGKRKDRPPFLDYSCLNNNRFLQFLLVSTMFAAFGSYSPLFNLGLECMKVEAPTTQVVYLYLYIGAGWVLGSCIYGTIVVQKNEDCRISKPYLLQASTLIIGGSLLALATMYENHGLGGFCWAYGFGLGSYNYVLKAWVYEKAKAKNFSRAWSFVTSAQGFGCVIGVPLTSYMNNYAGWRTGYYMSSASVLLSALVILCCGMERRQLAGSTRTSSMKTCETLDSSGMQSPTVRRISFTFPDEQISPRLVSKGSNRSAGSGSIAANNTPDKQGDGSINGFNCANFAHYSHHPQQPFLLQEQPQVMKMLKEKELTSISEEPHGQV